MNSRESRWSAAFQGLLWNGMAWPTAELCRFLLLTSHWQLDIAGLVCTSSAKQPRQPVLLQDGHFEAPQRILRHASAQTGPSTALWLMHSNRQDARYGVASHTKALSGRPSYEEPKAQQPRSIVPGPLVCHMEQVHRLCTEHRWYWKWSVVQGDTV